MKYKFFCAIWEWKPIKILNPVRSIPEAGRGQLMNAELRCFARRAGLLLAARRGGEPRADISPLR